MDYTVVAALIGIFGAIGAAIFGPFIAVMIREKKRAQSKAQSPSQGQPQNEDKD